MKHLILCSLSLALLASCQKNEVVEPAPRDFEPPVGFQCGDTGHVRFMTAGEAYVFIGTVSTCCWSTSCLTDTLPNDLAVHDTINGDGHLFPNGEYCLYASNDTSAHTGDINRVIFGGGPVTEIQFFDLQLVGFDPHVYVQNTQVSSVDLSEVGGAERFGVVDNASLTSVTLPAPEDVPFLREIFLYNNALDAQSVDNAIIMAYEAHMAGVPIQTVRLEGGTNASPTLASETQRMYLLDQEVTLIVNP